MLGVLSELFSLTEYLGHLNSPIGKASLDVRIKKNISSSLEWPGYACAFEGQRPQMQMCYPHGWLGSRNR